MMMCPETSFVSQRALYLMQAKYIKRKQWKHMTVSSVTQTVPAKILTANLTRRNGNVTKWNAHGTKEVIIPIKYKCCYIVVYGLLII